MGKACIKLPRRQLPPSTRHCSECECLKRSVFSDNFTVWMLQRMTDAPCLSSTPRSGVIAPNESATHGTGRDAGTDDCTWRNPNGNNVCIACDLAGRRWRIADYERVSPEARCGRSYVLSLALYSTHLAWCEFSFTPAHR